MFGLPFDTWTLIVSSVGLGLLLEWLFLRARRRVGDRDGNREDRR